MSRVRTGGVVVAAMLLGAAAPKPPAASYWAQRPTPAEEEAAWAKVSKPGAAGRAVMVCKAQAGGALSDCQVRLERPTGAGLGAAVLSMAPLFRVNLSAPHAPAVGEEVVVPMSNVKADTSADWLRKPTSDDLMQVWPTQAWAHARGGEGVVNCLVSVQGALFDCAVISEKPPGEHFGEAALALTPQFLMRPATLAGQPVVSVVNVPIHFYMEPGSAPPGPSDRHIVVLAVMSWPQAPSYAAVVAAYPPKAREARLGGRATLECEFDKQGRIGHCSTLAEEPRRQGFADAARTLAEQFRAVNKMPDGRSISGARVQLPVIFDPAMLNGDTPVVGKAQWTALPSAEDTTAAFSKLAVSGTNRVVLACVVQQGGAVSDCHAVSEEPAGRGLAAAALSLAPHFRLSTWTPEGLPTVGATVNIPVRYEAGAAAPKS
jgi:TonB family protein